MAHVSADTNQWQPVDAKERCSVLDILRGAVLLGVLLVNVLSAFQTCLKNQFATFDETMRTTEMEAQHLPSYIERPPDAAGVYAIWPGSGVPKNSET